MFAFVKSTCYHGAIHRLDHETDTDPLPGRGTRSLMDLHLLDDLDLMALIARGDANALAELYDRYGRPVYSLALNTVGDRAIAEEITQDVFTRVWQHASRYDPQRAQVHTWISRIARNRSIDATRRQRARGSAIHIPWDDLIADVVSVDDNPEAETLLRARQQRVRQALQALPDAQRQPLALAYFEGLSHREIAERLDQPLGTIKTRIRLAMQKLRTILEEEAGH